jgi:hypothetical protein
MSLKSIKMLAVLGAASALVAVLAGEALSQKKMEMPFGGEKDVAFAKSLWSALKSADIVGAGRINVRPFEGNEPHGAIQQVLETKLQVQKTAGRVVVKVNHMGAGANVDTVYATPNKYVAAYTVMFKMPAGYDPENKDWFWVKYNPDGSIDKSPQGMKLAGRVAKGMDEGCIACHRKIGGDDMEVLKK